MKINITEEKNGTYAILLEMLDYNYIGDSFQKFSYLTAYVYAKVTHILTHTERQRC